MNDFTKLYQLSSKLGSAMPPRDRIIQLSSMARRRTEELCDEGYSFEELTPFFDGMAEKYLGHAEDRYTLYRLCPDVAQTVDEAKKAHNVIAYIFYGKVHNLILHTLMELEEMELEEMDREYRSNRPRTVKEHQRWW